jgi:CRP/FNR family cyclic AMP-dependent transcriptional regulator
VTQSIEELLAHHQLLRGLPVDVVAQVAGCSRNVVFHPGELLLAEGDAADTFYLLRRGRVSIDVHAPGRGPIVIETVGEGAVVGWSWLVPPYRWTFDARALDEVGAVAVDGACLRGKALSDPGFGFTLLSRVAAVLLERLQATRLRLIDLYGGPRDA